MADDCCSSPDAERYEQVFDARFARKVAHRYRTKGLTPAERSIVAFAASTGIEGATVLEIGGGVGEIQLELLALGAARTTNLELSPSYEAEAIRLMRQAGVENRVTRLLGVDVASRPDEVEAADFVILHRVVCCYPDHARLLGSAADHARRALVFSHPPRTPFRRFSIAVENAVGRMLGHSYRAYVHDPAAMTATLASRGLEATYRTHERAWNVVGTSRE